MKKSIRLFSLVFILLMIITLSSCSVNKVYKEKTLTDEIISSENVTVETLKENEHFSDIKDYIIGFLYFDENNVEDTIIYISGDIPQNRLSHLTAVYDDSNSKGILPKLPTGLSVGSNFSGWFVQTADGEKRVTTVSDVTTFAKAKYMSYGEGGLVSLVCIAIVFIMLALLWGITSLFKFIAPKPKKQEAKEETSVQTQVARKVLTIDDITDENMMVAALVATIDYHNEIKEDVRVVSIKEIR